MLKNNTVITECLKFPNDKELWLSVTYDKECVDRTSLAKEIRDSYRKWQFQHTGMFFIDFINAQYEGSENIEFGETKILEV